MSDHTILGGKVHVYRRDNSRYWQCSAYLAGKNRRVSTKEESLSRAREIAEDWYLELRGKARSGEITSERTFSKAADQFVREYEVITGGHRNAKYVEDHQSRLRNHLVPYFGQMPLSDITPGKVQEYRIHRIKRQPGGDNERSFKEAAQQFERAAAAVKGAQRTALSLEGHRNRLCAHLIPFFGELPLSAITADKVQEYRAHRLRPADGGKPPIRRVLEQELSTVKQVLGWAKRLGKPPSRSTMHHEVVTLRQVLKTAIRHGWLKHLPDLSMPYGASSKITHRAWFSPEEYRTLYETTRRHARDGKGKPWQWAAEQLHDYVLFMANTGLRPDEANNLQHRDVAIVADDGTGETILEIEVRGKRGVGYCKSTTGAVRPYQRLLGRSKPRSGSSDGHQAQTQPEQPSPIDAVFPANHKKQFARILEQTGLKLDRQGNRRTAYSLRHTYICLRLMEGADIYQIAKNCRTSVEMIEKYYAAHIKNRLEAAAINVRRERPRKDHDPQRHPSS